jgi:mono/diheme cytochrome c family protein
VSRESAAVNAIGDSFVYFKDSAVWRNRQALRVSLSRKDFPMTKPTWTSIASCVAVLGLMAGGCDGTVKPTCSEEEGCSDNSQNANQGDEETAAGKRDAGKSDAGIKKDASAAAKDGGKGDKGGESLPCDVQAIITKNCGTCHGADTAFGAPMSLVTAADFAASAPTDGSKTVAQLTKTRINATTAATRMPPSPAKLSATDLAALNAWLDAGATGSSASCGGPAAGDAGAVKSDAGATNPLGDPHADPNLKCYKLLANSGDGKTPFKVGVARDAYYNVVLAAPWTGTVYARVMTPVIDNAKALHHWLLFQDDTPGRPGAPVRGSGAHPTGQLLMGWAPGGLPFDFRGHADDIGIELPGNTTYTIEFHYNSSDANAVDASGAEICVTSTKPTNVAGISWLGNDNLFVPSASWSGTCDPVTSSPIHLVYLSPHMHLQGRHQKAVINRKGGTKETLLDEDFDFNYQVAYATDAIINAGDTITTTCTYAQPMTFGESTTAEMCYMFTVAYPKGLLADSGGWGGIAHGGSSCLGM